MKNPHILKKIIAEWLEEFKLPPLVRRQTPTLDLEKLSEILAIVGPRRAGKTFYMYELMQNLLVTSYTKEDILFIDFEDYRLMDFHPDDVEELFVAFNQVTGRSPKFVFFDEVQHLPHWNRILRTLHNQRRFKLVISGSNSRLLDLEISKELRGRYKTVLMLPFSFAEALEFRQIPYSERLFLTEERGKILRAFDTYSREGGFPEVVRKESAFEKREVLQTYFRTIFYKDILERYNIKAKALLEAIMSYCVNVYSDLFSISAFEKSLRAHGQAVSKKTIANYLAYLEEAFFLIVNAPFSYSPRKQIMNPKKIYLLDIGFSFLATEFSENKGKVLENLVAIELFRRQEETFYYRGQQECDFIIKRGTRPTTAIQVSYQLHDHNRERELRGLVEAMDELTLKEGLVLTYNDEGKTTYKNHKIRILPVWQWLLSTPSASQAKKGQRK